MATGASARDGVRWAACVLTRPTDAHMDRPMRSRRHRPPPPPPSAAPKFDLRSMQHSSLLHAAATIAATQSSFTWTPQPPYLSMDANSFSEAVENGAASSEADEANHQQGYDSVPFAKRALPQTTRKAIRSTARKLGKAFAAATPMPAVSSSSSQATLTFSTPIIRARELADAPLQPEEHVHETSREVAALLATSASAAAIVPSLDLRGVCNISASAASAWNASQSSASAPAEEVSTPMRAGPPTPLDLDIPVAVRASASAATMVAVHACSICDDDDDAQGRPPPTIRPPLLEQWEGIRSKGVTFDEVVQRAESSGDSPVRTLPPFRLITRAAERLAEIQKAEEEIRIAEVDASREAALAVSMAAVGKVGALAHEQKLIESAAEAAMAARLEKQQQQLADRRAQQQRSLGWTDKRLHADQEGWRFNKRDEEASRGSTYRGWVSKLTGRTDVQADDNEADIVQGMWTCCESLDPNVPGCVHAAHSDAHLRCLQCGQWILKEHWFGEKCYFHPEEPVHERWGAERWTCCGKEGLNKSRYMKGKALAPWLDVASNWASSIKQRRCTMSETLERSGCQLGHHVHSHWPQCSHCDEMLPAIEPEQEMFEKRANMADPNETPFGKRHSVPNPICALCGTENRICTQCNDVAGPPRNPPSEGVPSDTRCRFHPGTWSLAWRTRMALKQHKSLPEPAPPDATKTPPVTRAPSPMLPPSSPPPTSVPPSPRRWADTECQTVVVHDHGTSGTQTYFWASEQTQTGDQMVSSSAQTDTLQTAWCGFHTSNRKQSKSVVISNWESLPVDFFKHGDKHSSGLVKQPEHHEWSGPTPLRERLNDSRKQCQRMENFSSTMWWNQIVRGIQRCLNSWKEFAEKKKANHQVLTFVAYKIMQGARWRPELGPLPASSTIAASVQARQQGGELSRLQRLSTLQQVALIRALVQWASSCALWKQRVRDEMQWVGRRLAYGLLHEAFAIWQRRWADDRGASLEKRMSLRKRTVSMGTDTSDDADMSRLFNDQRWSFLSKGEEFEEGTVVTADLADLVDPDDVANAIPTTTSSCQTSKAWEWAARERKQGYKLRGTAPTRDMENQTVPTGQPIQIGGPDLVHTRGTQTPAMDESFSTSKGTQTDFSEVFGTLESVYTKRKGNAAHNKVVEYANASDRVSRAAVAAANKRIAAKIAAKALLPEKKRVPEARIERPTGRAAEREEEEEEPGARTGTTWSYPAKVPSGYREDVKGPAALKSTASSANLQLRAVSSLSMLSEEHDAFSPSAELQERIERAKMHRIEPTAPTQSFASYGSPRLSSLASSRLSSVSQGSPTEPPKRFIGESRLFINPGLLSDSPTASIYEGTAEAAAPHPDEDDFAASNLTASLSAIAAVALSISKSFGPKEPRPSEVATRAPTTAQPASASKPRTSSSVAKLRASASLGRLMAKK